MSMNPNEFTVSWKELLARVDELQISRDDWDARCGRLAGFGLAAPVQPNPTRAGNEGMCFRVTGRGVRLLELLGRNVQPGAYPSMRYHPTKKPCVVQDENEDRALGAEWADGPFPENQA
jgi:hypothetical protein